MFRAFILPLKTFKRNSKKATPFIKFELKYSQMHRVQTTGYWTFFCNPKYWAIDSFLSEVNFNPKSQYRITSWQKESFERGQLGVIRVGTDIRTKLELNGRKRLERGIYALVEVDGEPFLTPGTGSSFKIENQKNEAARYSVPIRYLNNYIFNPILLSELLHDQVIGQDRYLLKGIQAATMPLQKDTFDRLLLYAENKK
jgi:hypothetical protein